MIDILWDDKYEIGNKRIDFEHQVFVDLIRQISLAAESGSDNERLARLMVELRKYAEFHFFSEENIMLDVDYPDYERHKHEHQILLATYDEMVRGFRYGEKTIDEVVQFIFEWFAFHTTQKDKRIAEFVDSTIG